MKKVIKRKEEQTIYFDELNVRSYIGVVDSGKKWHLIMDDKSIQVHSSEINYKVKYRDLEHYLESNPTDELYVFETKKELYKWLSE